MDNTRLEIFRLKFSVQQLQTFVLQLALVEPVLHHHQTIEQSQKVLKGTLDTNIQTADAVAGEMFPGDPAMAGLYAEEMREILEKMKKQIDKIAEHYASTKGS